MGRKNHVLGRVRLEIYKNSFKSHTVSPERSQISSSPFITRCGEVFQDLGRVKLEFPKKFSKKITGLPDFLLTGQPVLRHYKYVFTHIYDFAIQYIHSAVQIIHHSLWILMLSRIQTKDTNYSISVFFQHDSALIIWAKQITNDYCIYPLLSLDHKILYQAH